MQNKIKAFFIITIFVTFLFAGCTEPIESNENIDHQFLDMKNCGSRGQVNTTNLSLYDCQIIPLFDYVDDSGIQNKFLCGMNETVGITEMCSMRYGNSSINEVWVAYFSTPWCTLCTPTLDAYDQAIPEDRLFVFNKDADPQYTNMSSWKIDASDSLDRDVNRPFIHAPDLATELGVTGIPMTFFIDSHGVVIDYTLGKMSNASEVQERYESAKLLDENYVSSN